VPENLTLHMFAQIQVHGEIAVEVVNPRDPSLRADLLSNHFADKEATTNPTES
jgi:hypothetical protein